MCQSASRTEIQNAADYDLPKSGLLSLYVDNQNMVDDWYGCSAIIHNPKIDKLKRYPLPELTEYCDGDIDEQHLPTCARPPHRLTIRESVWLPFEPEWSWGADLEVINRYSDLCDHYGGLADLCGPDTPAGNQPQWKCLFKLNSCKYFEFGDVGHEYIFVRKKRDGLDFSKVTAEYSDV